MKAANKLAHVLFVVNPISGDIEKSDVLDLIKDFCATHKIQYAFFETTGQNDLDQLKTLLKTENYEAVFAVGGDGTSHLVGSALIHSEVALGIIPMGSGNGLSKDLGIPQDAEEALEVMLDPQFRIIDALSVNNSICVHLTDLGFNALVVKKFNEGEKRGASSYAIVALQEFLSYEPKLYHIETDHGSFSGRAFMVTITNANAFGSNATINPTGIIDDGKFEVCILEPFPKGAAIELLYRMYHDSIDKSVYTRIISCRQAEVLNQDHEEVQVDGEHMETGEKITIKLLPKSLKILTPRLKTQVAY